ncbi:hypothetical protein LZ32DRAFT_240092 [Colletotrichum eremochloae]|nr:hypothetical protein LZ32DRAFT_240092 [Colletotrichum eremochloae]
MPCLSLPCSSPRKGGSDSDPLLILVPPPHQTCSPVGEQLSHRGAHPRPSICFFGSLSVRRDFWRWWFSLSFFSFSFFFSFPIPFSHSPHPSPSRYACRNFFSESCHLAETATIPNTRHGHGNSLVCLSLHICVVGQKDSDLKSGRPGIIRSMANP